MMEKEAIEVTVAAAASKSTYAGAISMFVGWLLSNDAAILVGMLVGLFGLCVNWYYKHKAYQLLRDGQITREDYESINR